MKYWTLKKEIIKWSYKDIEDKTFYYQTKIEKKNIPLIAKSPCNCKDKFIAMGQHENFEMINGKLSVLERATGLSSFLLDCGAHFWISAGETVWAQDSKCGN